MAILGVCYLSAAMFIEICMHVVFEDL